MTSNIGDTYLHKKSDRRYVIEAICKHGKIFSNLPDIAIYHDQNSKSQKYYREVNDFLQSPDSGYKYIGNILDPYAEED